MKRLILSLALILFLLPGCGLFDNNDESSPTGDGGGGDSGETSMVAPEGDNGFVV